MRDPTRLDLAAIIALAASSFGALCYLAPTYARATRLARIVPPAPAVTPTWTPGPRRRRVVTAVPGSPRTPPSPQALGESVMGEANPERLDEAFTGLLSSDGPIDRVYEFGDEFFHHGYRHHGYSRYGGRYRRRSVRAAERPVMSWIDASQSGRGVSLCELLPSLCGSGSARPRGATPADSPNLLESPERITLSNEHLAIDIARVGRCTVRVQRAEERAETLLTFDLPDQLVPCEARVVPDVFHEDGVAVRVDASAPGWEQSITVALSADDDAPSLALSRVSHTASGTLHSLLNASPQAMTFTLDGNDFSAAPGEALTLTSP